jgi:ABC-type branched-subunit amino acid transport system substrate-binding protein
VSVANGRLRIGACLSLSGRFASFGQQAARALEAWSYLDGTADILVEDDRSDQKTLETVLPGLAARCDLLLGPYSTQLMRAAGRMAAESGWLVWNHGPRDLCVAYGSGSFGRQVADGAEAIARGLGIRTVRASPDGQLPPPGMSPEWDLFSAGVFEQDAELTGKALRLPVPPRHVCAMAAGVREFARAVDDPEGVFGIAQWFPGGRSKITLGPSEDDFLRAYAERGGLLPDYPAVQAAAGAVLATHCARLADGTDRDSLWTAAAGLKTSTLFGGFAVDPVSGAQIEHRTILVRWTGGELGAWPEERPG